MPTLSTSPRALGWLALTCLPLACTGAGGTPTPEPPDNLPPPVITLPTFMPEVRAGAAAALAPTRLVGIVRPGEDVWVVNLDAREVAPVRVAADADGTFVVTVVGARDGDRIRVIARTATRHSKPADLVIVGVANQPGTFQAPAPSALACLSVTPSEELTAVVETDGSNARAFTLGNRCSEPVRIEGATLRLGDQGIAILPPSVATLAAGAEARLPVTFESHADARERADVVLLEVAVDDPEGGGVRVGRYALGVYSVSASSLGNP